MMVKFTEHKSYHFNPSVSSSVVLVHSQCCATFPSVLERSLSVLNRGFAFLNAEGFHVKEAECLPECVAHWAGEESVWATEWAAPFPWAPVTQSCLSSPPTLFAQYWKSMFTS